MTVIPPPTAGSIWDSPQWRDCRIGDADRSERSVRAPRFFREGVAQTQARLAGVLRAESGVGDGRVLFGGVTTGGAGSGPSDPDLVAVELGEVVGCHQ